MDFWGRLKNEIKAQNTTQEWIAGKIGVPLSTFKKWMTRRTYPDLKQGVEIAKLLETSAEFLVTGIGAEGLTEPEKELIEAFRKLSSNDRKNAILAINVEWKKKCR